MYKAECNLRHKQNFSRKYTKKVKYSIIVLVCAGCSGAGLQRGTADLQPGAQTAGGAGCQAAGGCRKQRRSGEQVCKQAEDRAGGSMRHCDCYALACTQLHSGFQCNLEVFASKRLRKAIAKVDDPTKAQPIPALAVRNSSVTGWLNTKSFSFVREATMTHNLMSRRRARIHHRQRSGSSRRAPASATGRPHSWRRWPKRRRRNARRGRRRGRRRRRKGGGSGRSGGLLRKRRRRRRGQTRRRRSPTSAGAHFVLASSGSRRLAPSIRRCCAADVCNVPCSPNGPTHSRAAAFKRYLQQCSSLKIIALHRRLQQGWPTWSGSCWCSTSLPNQSVKHSQSSLCHRKIELHVV